MKIDYKKMLKDLYTSILYILAFMGLVFAVLIYINSQDKSSDNTPDIASESITQDPDVLNTVKSVGAKDYEKLTMVSGGAFPLSCTENTGCYADGIIFLEEGYKTDKTTVAHEYLHYMWYKNQLDKDDRLVSDLISSYARTIEFQNLISKYYIDRGILVPTELFSFACTEIQDSHLTPYIVQKCNEYIDRSTLQMKF